MKGVLTYVRKGVGGCTREIEALYLIKKRAVSLARRVVC